MINDASPHLNGAQTLRLQGIIHTELVITEKMSEDEENMRSRSYRRSDRTTQRLYEATCKAGLLAAVIGHCTVAGDLNTSAYLVPDVRQSKVQVGGLWVQLDVREHVTKLHSTYWSTQVAGLEGNAQCVSVVYQGCTAGEEVGHTSDTDRAVATSTARELAVGEDAVEQADFVRVGSLQGWVREDDLDWNEGDSAWCTGHTWFTILPILAILTSRAYWTCGARGSHVAINTSRPHRAFRSGVTLPPADRLEANLS